MCLLLKVMVHVEMRQNEVAATRWFSLVLESVGAAGVLWATRMETAI